MLAKYVLILANQIALWEISFGKLVFMKTINRWFRRYSHISTVIQMSDIIPSIQKSNKVSLWILKKVLLWNWYGCKKNSTQLKISNWNTLYISKYGAYRKVQISEKYILVYRFMNNTFFVLFYRTWSFTIITHHSWWCL